MSASQKKFDRKTAPKAVEPEASRPKKKAAPKAARKAERKPAEKPAPKSEGKKARKLGLVGRIALIAICTAIAATVIQLTVTPLLLRKQFDMGRLVYAGNAAKQLALIADEPMVAGDSASLNEMVSAMGDPLPDGRALVLDTGGKVLSASKGAAGLAGDPQIKALVRSAQGGVVKLGENLWDPLESTCRHASLSIL